MRHLMLDIETLGNEAGAVITSIAAVQFDLETGNIGETFYKSIKIQDSLDNGLFVNGSTILWWLEQSDDARRCLIEGQKEALSLSNVLYEFRSFIQGLQPADLQVWGNSNRFDMGLLYEAYKANGQAIPWKYTLERDVRTLVSFFPQYKENEPFVGVYHNPVDDCLHQIKYCVKTFRNIQNAQIALDITEKMLMSEAAANVTTRITLLDNIKADVKSIGNDAELGAKIRQTIHDANI